MRIKGGVFIAGHLGGLLRDSFYFDAGFDYKLKVLRIKLIKGKDVPYGF